MGDNVAQADRPQRVPSGAKRHTFRAAPTTITIREIPLRSGAAESESIVDKWIYILDESGSVRAEIYAESADVWRVDYQPPETPAPLEKFDQTTAAQVVVKKPLLDEGKYRLFLSPVRAGSRCRKYLKDHVSDLSTLALIDKTFNEVPVALATDFYAYTEFMHASFAAQLRTWEQFVENPDRQGKLFVASVLDSWLADGDKADIGDYLKDRRAPRRILDEFKSAEQVLRGHAEGGMVAIATLIEGPSHMAIDVAAEEGGARGAAVALIHWGIVSQGMLRVAPGRVFAKKLFDEDVAFVSRVIFSDSSTPDLPGAYGTFKKVYAASLGIVVELLPAKVRHIRESAGAARSSLEKVRLYLQKVGIETELKGAYRTISERLEAGERITARLSGAKRERVITTTQKLIKKADAEIPDYDARATRTLESADRLEMKSKAVDVAGASVQVILDMVSLITAIEEYRAAFPDSKDQKLIAIVGSGGDFYASVAQLSEKFSKRARLWGVTGGVAGFVSGVIDMLDAEEKAVKSAYERNDYRAAVGHTITAVGASMTALAAGVLFAKAVSGGAVFGGPFGAIVGAIGAGLMALGMLIVSFFSDNDYQTFAKHCFLGTSHGRSVTPDWATVSFGSGSVRNEVIALYDLLYRFKVSLVKTVKVTPALPRDNVEFSGLKLTISPGYADAEDSTFMVELTARPISKHVRDAFKFEVRGLRLPNADSSVYTHDASQTTRITQRWSPMQLWSVDREGWNRIREKFPIVKNLHLYDTEFSLEVQLVHGGRAVGQPVRMRGTMGGREKFGHIETREWNRVEFE